MSTIIIKKETNRFNEIEFAIYEELENDELLRIGGAGYELDEETGEVIEIGGYADQRYVHGRDIEELAASIEDKLYNIDYVSIEE